MLESGVGRGAALALAAAPGLTHPADLAPPGRLLAEDLVLTPWELHDGAIPAPPAPGLGFEVDRGALERATISVTRFPPDRSTP